MDDQTRRFGRQEDEEDALRLDDVLEPYEEDGTPEDGGEYGDEDDSYPPGYEPSYDELYGEEYSDYHEAIDEASRFKMALGVFDTVSILVGVVVILLLVAMLVSLAGWLRSDILHSALLLQSGLQ